jgi:hypothetical protein
MSQKIYKTTAGASIADGYFNFEAFHYANELSTKTIKTISSEMLQVRLLRLGHFSPIKDQQTHPLPWREIKPHAPALE